jgi:hypothetical protein
MHTVHEALRRKVHSHNVCCIPRLATAPLAHPSSTWLSPTWLPQALRDCLPTVLSPRFAHLRHPFAPPSRPPSPLSSLWASRSPALGLRAHLHAHIRPTSPSPSRSSATSARPTSRSPSRPASHSPSHPLRSPSATSPPCLRCYSPGYL